VRAGSYGLLSGLAAIWGLSFVFFRVGVPLLGGFLFVELRLLLAVPALLAYAVARRTLRSDLGSLRRRWKDYVIIGVANTALPFSLIAFAELTLPASLASVLNATTPLFSVLLAVPMAHRPLTARRVGGVALGLVGVVVLVQAGPLPFDLVVLRAAAMSLLAAVLYAVGTHLTRLRLTDVPSAEIALNQTLIGTFLLVPLALLELPTARFTAAAVVSVVAIALVCTAFAYLIFFHLVQSEGATQAVSVTFLVPIFGVAWGEIFLGEPVGPGLLVGTAMVLAAVALVNDLFGSRRRAEAGGPVTATPPPLAPGT
jgi:drug/metabolite transporter (DMT)-like permease